MYRSGRVDSVLESRLWFEVDRLERVIAGV